jgi:hypothetical protein
VILCLERSGTGWFTAEATTNRIPTERQKYLMAPSAQDVAVFAPLIIGLSTTSGTIVIHGLAGLAVVHFVRYERRLGRAGVRFWKDLAFVFAATVFTLTARLAEILMWAIVFAACGEFAQLGGAFYHSR